MNTRSNNGTPAETGANPTALEALAALYALLGLQPTAALQAALADLLCARGKAALAA